MTGGKAGGGGDDGWTGDGGDGGAATVSASGTAGDRGRLGRDGSGGRGDSMVDEAKEIAVRMKALKAEWTEITGETASTEMEDAILARKSSGAVYANA